MNQGPLTTPIAYTLTVEAPMTPSNPEQQRLTQDARRTHNWKRWGPYLAERQWGTVREDYSADGNVWDYFPHSHARSRAYRWGEDGLLGICDRECRLCFALALWNGQDPILKERLFGLSNPQGNHGEDVKECYFYLDSTPTHSYLKALYKYPQAKFPYCQLLAENRRRTRLDPEYEIIDTGIFNGDRYFDITAEYAKAAAEDICILLTIANHGPDPAVLHLLPTLWFRNAWVWGCKHEGCEIKPDLRLGPEGLIETDHVTLGRHRLAAHSASDGTSPQWLFTDNETNMQRLFHIPNLSRYVKDAFHDYVIHDHRDAVNPAQNGTKVAAYYRLTIPAHGQITVPLRLFAADQRPPHLFGASFEHVLADRKTEADLFYNGLLKPLGKHPEHRRIARQAFAGLLWSKQFYHYSVRDWLEGDPEFPPPPAARWYGRNADWLHLFNRDVVSMPDKWEYPWYAAWDLAFHMLTMAQVDPEFAKDQLLLFLREWYLHPNGQLPAYEFNFSDVNPPVHAWACWRVYKITGARGRRDRVFLARTFQKLLLNFTWWVNRKDAEGRHIFAGGFLGLDNIGVFDRSKPLPTGHLQQADGTAWMAFYCGTMLSMALELAVGDPAYEDMASKFFEHFVHIIDAINTLGGTGLWDQDDGFYYDQVRFDHQNLKLKVRSLVGLIPLIAGEIIEQDTIDRLPAFTKRMQWFLQHRADLAHNVSYMCTLPPGPHPGCHYLLAIPSQDRLVRVLRYLLDEREFLSPFGIRSLSAIYGPNPYVLKDGDVEYRVAYAPGESDSGLFGGNSNWRGPIWLPLNYLLIEALERYDHFYGSSLQVEYPTGSGHLCNLGQVAAALSRRVAHLFFPGPDGQRPCCGGDLRYATDPHWRDLLLFHEYFHAETGKGLGASHQTGWTSLIARLLE